MSSPLPRRTFLKSMASTAAVSVAAGLSLTPSKAQAAAAALRVWSCGGLSEGMLAPNAAFETQTGAQVSYTGAFAAALGKSLLASSETDVFAGRVLDLAKKLRASGRMDWFKPLCFTSYVIATPKGNPAGIASVEDFGKAGVRGIFAPEASPPGGAASMAILQKAGVKDQALAQAVELGSCVQRVMDSVLSGQAAGSIVELRVTRLPRFAGSVEVVPIAAGLFPPGPLTFTVGLMKNAQNKDLAARYIDHILSPASQTALEQAGFIPADSPQGQALIEKLGVKDV